MLGDVRRFRLLDQDITFVLPHLATADHVVNQVTGAFDGERAETGSGPDDFAHGACHLAASFKADLVGSGGHFRRGIPRVGRSVARTPPRGGGGRWGITFETQIVVNLRRVSHGANGLLPPDT